MISSFSVLIKRSTNNTYDMFTCLGRSLPTVTNVSLVFQLHFVRHYVDHHGIHPLEDKVSQCKCLVLINFYYCFFTNCAQILQPLNTLLSHSKTKPKEVHWKTEALSTEVKEALVGNFLQCICQSSTFIILWKDVSFMFSRTTNHSHTLFHLALIDTSHDKSVIWISFLNSPETSDMSNALKRLYQMLCHVCKQMHYNKTKRWQQFNVKTLNSFKYNPFHLHLIWNPYPYKCQTLQFFVTLLLVYSTLSF